MSSGFRLPLPANLEPSLSSSIPNFRPTKLSKLGSVAKIVEISNNLSKVAARECAKAASKSDRKRSKHELGLETRLISALKPERLTGSKTHSFWNQFRIPLDARFSETYVTSGWSSPDGSNPNSSGGENVADFVRKTRDLLLNEEVLKEVDAAAPGDQLLEIKPKLGKKALKKIKKAERDSTKGEDWFNMRAPEMTPELQNELDVLRMRAAIDPSRFYKKNDSSVPPKYFQIGHVIDSPADYYSDRIPKKDRKKTLVDELLADAEFKKFSKRKYVEIIEEKSKTQRKRFKHAGKGKKSAKPK